MQSELFAHAVHWLFRHTNPGFDPAQSAELRQLPGLQRPETQTLVWAYWLVQAASPVASCVQVVQVLLEHSLFALPPVHANAVRQPEAHVPPLQMLSDPYRVAHRESSAGSAQVAQMSALQSWPDWQTLSERQPTLQVPPLQIWPVP